jgi:acyl transferase domain-containing protein
LRNQHRRIEKKAGCLYDREVNIVGMSCRFPGGANDLHHYFDLLLSGKDTILPISESWKKVCKTQFASFLDEKIAYSFDPEFFGLSEEEILLMDPHQRILLEVIYEALIDAGIFPFKDSTMMKDRVGVFIGMCNNEWMRIANPICNGNCSPFSGPSLALSSCANRISYLFGLGGPSMVIDTACSSSLTAVHVAQNALRNNECDVAIVASADLLLSPLSIQVRICL